MENFPVTGTDNVVYIDGSNNMAYKWDNTIGAYSQLNISPDSAIHISTNLQMSSDPPSNTNCFWVDTNDNGFIKYYDGAIWRKSNLALLVDPSCIDKHKWILIPDPTDPEDNGSNDNEDNSESSSKWIVIPDEED